MLTKSLPEYGKWIFSTLAWEISRYPETFLVELKGHTEKGYSPPGEYGTWEISADRAKAARRKLLEHGLNEAQVRKVAGFGNTAPMPDSKAEDEVTIGGSWSFSRYARVTIKTDFHA